MVTLFDSNHYSLVEAADHEFSVAVELRCRQDDDLRMTCRYTDWPKAQVSKILLLPRITNRPGPVFLNVAPHGMAGMKLSKVRQRIEYTLVMRKLNFGTNVRAVDGTPSKRLAIRQLARLMRVGEWRIRRIILRGQAAGWDWTSVDWKG